jgi:putative photosynthetic complex assembly protein
MTDISYNQPQNEPRMRADPKSDMIPRPLLRAMLGLVLATLAMTTYAVVTDRAHVGTPADAAVVAERAVILQGGGARKVRVLDVNGAVLMDLPHGGSITVIQNGLERERFVARVDQTLPVRIVEFANGRLAVIDDATGWSAELGAFGSLNRDAFEALMSLK